MKITLVGSTRFRDAFEKYNQELSMRGHLVYSLPMFGRHTASEVGNPKDASQPEITDREKAYLDLLHLGKIEESDAILVLNVGGYVGESTKKEIMWAQMRSKIIGAIEPNQNLGGQPVAVFDDQHLRVVTPHIWPHRIFNLGHRF